jgi:hypothetical protein
VVCVTGQLFGIVVMARNDGIHDACDVSNANCIARPKSIILSMMLIIFGGWSFILQYNLYYVKDTLNHNFYFWARTTLILSIVANIVVQLVYYYELLGIVLAALVCATLLVVCTPPGWVLIWSIRGVLKMMRKSSEESDRHNSDANDSLLRHNSNTVYCCKFVMLCDLYTIVFLTFWIAIASTGAFERDDVSLPLN